VDVLVSGANAVVNGEDVLDAFQRDISEGIDSVSGLCDGSWIAMIVFNCRVAW